MLNKWLARLCTVSVWSFYNLKELENHPVEPTPAEYRLVFLIILKITEQK